jgi:hypothetical protein
MAILLDPALSRDLLATLRRQTASCNIELIDVLTPNGTSARDALRAASDAHDDAIVGLAAEDDAAFFEGRGRRFSVMNQHYRFGATLTRYPHLIPPVPPDPPTVWDDKRDREKPLPRIVDADLELVVEGGNPDLGGDKGLATLQEQLSEQRSNNQVPSFPLHAVLPWLEKRSGTRISFLVGDAWNRWARYGIQALDSDPGDETKTEVWIHERRLHLRGPGSEQLAPLLKPHVVMIADRVINAFREALRTRNPITDERFHQLVAEARSVALDLNPWLQKQIKLVSTESADTSVLAFTAAEESSARVLLDEICNRAWHFPARDRNTSWSEEPPHTLPFWFRRAARSPLILLAPDEFCQLRLIASLGAGRVLRVRLSRFLGSAANALRVTEHHGKWQLEVDGGDVHMWLRTEYDEMLEAESLAPRKRRDDASRSSDDDD